jgi:hypothetical protein
VSEEAADERDDRAGLEVIRLGSKPMLLPKPHQNRSDRAVSALLRERQEHPET